jgi:hypothetical protein
MIKYYLSAVVLLCLNMPAFAQYTPQSEATSVNHTTTVSIGLGTTGINLEGKVALNKHFNARLGASILPLSYNGPLTLDGVHTQATADATLSKINLLAEYKPFSKAAIRLVGGLAYVFATPGIILHPTQNYKLGQTTLTPNDLGQMNINVDWSGIAPYLGVAFFHDFPKRKFNINADLGMYYLSKPKTTWSGTNLLNDNQSNQQQLDDNLSGYRWYPEIKISFNYKVSK